LEKAINVNAGLEPIGTFGGGPTYQPRLVVSTIADYSQKDADDEVVKVQDEAEYLSRRSRGGIDVNEAFVEDRSAIVRERPDPVAALRSGVPLVVGPEHVGIE
jgi:hypothetical protein